jgi:hypothetical protein
MRRPIDLKACRSAVPDETHAERGTRGRHPAPEAVGVTAKQRYLKGGSIVDLPYQNTAMGNGRYRCGTWAEHRRIKIDERPTRLNLAGDISREAEYGISACLVRHGSQSRPRRRQFGSHQGTGLLERRKPNARPNASERFNAVRDTLGSRRKHNSECIVDSCSQSGVIAARHDRGYSGFQALIDPKVDLERIHPAHRREIAQAQLEGSSRNNRLSHERALLRDPQRPGCKSRFRHLHSERVRRLEDTGQSFPAHRSPDQGRSRSLSPARRRPR